jgi:hypothetical protein
VNCRNTQCIAAYCGEILGIQLDTLEDAPSGSPPKATEVNGMRDVVRQAERVIKEWCLRERGGLQPRQVAILTHDNDTSVWPKKFGNIQVVRNLARWRANDGILLETYRRFKGLEADALILAGVPQPDPTSRYTAADHYVASSRAKHLLEIVFDRGL